MLAGQRYGPSDAVLVCTPDLELLSSTWIGAAYAAE